MKGALTQKSSDGFTLIEFIIVIIIIAILAAVAIPRFINLGTNARAAAVDGMYGSVLAAANLAHSMSMVAGDNPASVTMAGKTITMVNGYPADTASGIGNAITDASGFAQGNNAEKGWDFKIQSAHTPTSCMVTYVQPTANGKPPTVIANKKNCT